MTGILLILNLILIPRVFVFFSNRSLTIPRLAILLSPLVAVLILFEINLIILGLVILYCLMVILNFTRERGDGQNDVFRILSLFVYVIILAAVGLIWEADIRIRFDIPDAGLSVLNIYMFGFLFLLNEVNLISKICSNKIKSYPKRQRSKFNLRTKCRQSNWTFRKKYNLHPCHFR